MDNCPHTDTRTALEKYADTAALHHPFGGDVPNEQVAPKAFAALRAVLDLHQPRDSVWAPQQCGHCADLCHSSSGLGCDQPEAPWPCATVHAIQSALGDTDV